MWLWLLLFHWSHRIHRLHWLHWSHGLHLWSPIHRSHGSHGLYWLHRSHRLHLGRPIHWSHGLNLGRPIHRSHGLHWLHWSYRLHRSHGLNLGRPIHRSHRSHRLHLWSFIHRSHRLHGLHLRRSADWLRGLLGGHGLAHPRGIDESHKGIVERHGGRRRGLRLCLLLLRHCRLGSRHRFGEGQNAERIRIRRLRLRFFRGEIRFRTVRSFNHRGLEGFGLLGKRREKQGIGKRGSVENGSSKQNADFPLLLLDSQLFIHIHKGPYLGITIEFRKEHCGSHLWTVPCHA